MTSPISFERVTKAYGALRVLDCVSFDVRDGETVGLIGVNGAGKSTLLKCLLNLVECDAGHCEIFGVKHTMTRAKKELSYLPERFVPPNFAGGHDLLRFLCNLHGVEYDVDQAVDYCQRLDLDPAALSRRAAHYSKGMTQKLGLIACLLAHKPLLVMDEPMSGLDPKARALFKTVLTDLSKGGATLLFTTHLLEDVAVLCDRIAVLDDGRLRYFGATSDFLECHESDSLEQAFLNCIDNPINKAHAK